MLVCGFFSVSILIACATIKWGDLDLFLVYFMVSYSTATIQPLHTQFFIKKCDPFSSLFKPANRSHDFRNGVTWSYTGLEAHSSCSFVYSCNSRSIMEEKLDKMIFQQSEHPICTRKYSYHS